jgi:hypothetical protein
MRTRVHAGRRLRPVVHASPTVGGIHVRGWRSSFTVEGSAALWPLWCELSRRLETGESPLTWATRAETHAAGLIMAQLREHDMLVDPAEAPDWLAAVSPDPAESWHRLQAARVVVEGDDPVARSAVQALKTSVQVVRDEQRTPGTVLRTGAAALAVRCDDRAGFAGVLNRVHDTEAISARLELSTKDPDPGLAALVGSAAAQRLLYAIAGLAVDDRVLVAHADPLRSSLHLWLPGMSTSDGGLDALIDPELGPLPPPRYEHLPQLPLAIATAGPVLGYGTTTEEARRNAVLATAERQLSVAGCTAAVAPNREEAVGVLLRKLAFDLVESGRPARGFSYVRLALGRAIEADEHTARTAAERAADAVAQARRAGEYVDPAFARPGITVDELALQATLYRFTRARIRDAQPDDPLVRALSAVGLTAVIA